MGYEHVIPYSILMSGNTVSNPLVMENDFKFRRKDVLIFLRTLVILN